MHIKAKKCFGLILVSGVLLLAYDQLWKTKIHSGVDIRPKPTSMLKKALERQFQEIPNGYQDIAYRTKKDVAR